jgi:hypothetical protein
MTILPPRATPRLLTGTFPEEQRARETHRGLAPTPAILFFGDLIERTRDLDAAIIERHIETTMGGYDEVNRLHDVGILGDVCAEKRCGAAGFSDLGGDIRAFLLPEPGSRVSPQISYLLPPVAAGWLEDWDAVASSLASQLRISSTNISMFALPVSRQ